MGGKKKGLRSKLRLLSYYENLNERKNKTKYHTPRFFTHPNIMCSVQRKKENSPPKNAMKNCARTISYYICVMGQREVL